MCTVATFASRQPVDLEMISGYVKDNPLGLMSTSTHELNWSMISGYVSNAMTVWLSWKAVGQASRPNTSALKPTIKGPCRISASWQKPTLQVRWEG